MTDLLSNPFVLSLLGCTAAMVGMALSKLVDRAFTQGREENALAVELASMRSTLAHVVADQKAHSQAQNDLNELKITVARIEARSVEKWASIEQSIKLIDSQNRAIWRRLNSLDKAA